MFVFTDTNVLRRPKSVLACPLLLLVLDDLLLGLRRVHAGYVYPVRSFRFGKGMNSITERETSCRRLGFTEM